VSALALLALGAVRVGARALAEPQQLGTSPAAAPVVASPSGAGPEDPAGTAPDLGLDRLAPSAAPDWAATLAAVDAGRLGALATGSVTALRDWVDPAGPSWAADAALAARVSTRKARIEGGALVVLEVKTETSGSTRSVLLVHDRRDSYAVVTATGTSRVPSRAPRWWRVTLVRAAGPAARGTAGWRVHDVAPVAAPTG
jgi:hypothetical protein